MSQKPEASLAQQELLTDRLNEVQSKHGMTFILRRSTRYWMISAVCDSFHRLSRSQGSRAVSARSSLHLTFEIFVSNNYWPQIRRSPDDKFFGNIGMNKIQLIQWWKYLLERICVYDGRIDHHFVTVSVLKSLEAITNSHFDVFDMCLRPWPICDDNCVILVYIDLQLS